MTTHLDGRDGLVLVAGDNLWHELDAVAQWGDQLRDVRIVHTHGGDELHRPGDRLRSFVRRQLPDAHVELVGPVPGDDAPLFTDAVARVVADEPGRWAVNVSGGTRLMFAGALELARRYADVALLHREDPSTWHRLSSDGAAVPVPGVDPAAMDRFTVADLVVATWADHDREVRIVDRHTPQSVVDAAERCVNGGQDWQVSLTEAMEGLRAAGQTPSAGPAFEALVGAMLRLLGVTHDDVELGVVLVDGEEYVQEVDVVVNSRGRLHVIDCKLREDDDARQVPIGIQVREADSTRRQIGDGCGHYILLRPNRTVGDEFRRLCQAYDVQVVDQPVLAERTLPEVLAQLVRTPRTPARAVPVVVEQRSTLDLSASVVDVAAHFESSGEPWLLCDLGVRQVLLCRFEGRRSREEFLTLLAARFGPEVDVVQAAVSQTGKTGRAVLTSSDRGELSRRVAAIPRQPW